MTTTKIKGRWIVAFDGAEHRLVENGVVVYSGATIDHAGRDDGRPADRVIDAGNDLVMPGLINTHVHIGSQAGDRMILDGGRRDLFRSGFLNHWPAKGRGGTNLFAFEDVGASLRYSLASLARFGSTTVVEMGGEFEDDPAGLANLAAELGIRLYTAPGFASAGYYYDQGGRLNLAWDEAGGLAALDRAIAFAEAHDGDHDGLIRAILVPFEFYTSTPELLTGAKRAAERLGIGITLHCSESVIEVHDTIRRTGKTPIQVLADLGVLGPEVVLGHGLYTGGHSQIAFPFDTDLQLLAESGTSVAHCPAVFARRGVVLESFDRYRDAGVNLALGTDSYPQDIVEEMKFAAIMAKAVTRSFEAGNARDVFNAATLGGARALGRGDLGRLAPGAAADIVIVDFARLRIGPLLDPIRALIHCGSGEMVRHVVVAGRDVIADGRVLAWDEGALLAAVRRSTEDAWSRFADYHAGTEPLDAAYPPSFRRLGGT